ncbi:MAG: nucleoside recognition domain-containing protein [Bacteroidales bacterium]|nr:nucleoside recognition domain-containing protein [Bacteroidales bacterium]
MKNNPVKKLWDKIPAGIVCLAVLGIIFGYLATVMGTPNMLNTLMKTAHDLLLNTVFYLMAICVLTSALSQILMDFGVVDLLEKLLRPLMKPLFNLPGVASLGAVMTFLSDNPAIISLSQDKKFSHYFKKYQLISLTNFGTAFGMGLIVIVFMVGQGFYWEPFVGLFGAFCGCIVSTRLMQRAVVKAYPKYKEENVVDHFDEEEEAAAVSGKSLFSRIMDSLLDGGKVGVGVGLAIIPGVLIISTLVMIMTFGPSETGAYTGAAYEGTEILPWAAGKINFIFDWLFGFKDPHLVAFPVTALGAVGAALGLVPTFIADGFVDGNAIAVFTAIGMCWSGYLSTHTAMLDSLGYRDLTPKAIGAHTVGGVVAGITAHLVCLLISLI